jgi:hypothetical protein
MRNNNPKQQQQLLLMMKKAKYTAKDSNFFNKYVLFNFKNGN